MSTTTTDIWGYQATVGAASRLRWSATDLGFTRHAAAIAPMPSIHVAPAFKAVKSNGIRRRPSGDST
ncbi:MAG: hypothetical protein U0P45_05425 [Acidimicrobiales bacterium]